MKGKTIIELKDVKTGKFEKYVDHNMMTNALKYVFQELGVFKNSLIGNTNYTNNLVKAMLGGILAFDTRMTESVETVTPESGVSMTANGAVDVVSNDTVTEMGSYNSQESGWMQDGTFKMVFDFTTSQGNGTINCVCLTSQNFGYIGAGNGTSNQSKSSKWGLNMLTDTQNTVSIDGGGYQLQRVFRGSFQDSEIQMVDYNNFYYSAGTAAQHFSQTGKLKINRHRVGLNKFDLRSVLTNSVHFASYEITLPQAFLDFINADGRASNNYFTTYQNDGYFYLIGLNYDGFRSSQTTWNNNASIIVVKIAPDNTVTYKTYTNTTGLQLSCQLATFEIVDDCIVTKTTNSNYPIFVIDDQGTYSQLEGGGNAFWTHLSRSGIVIMSGNIIDVNEKTSKPTNGTVENSWRNIFADNPLIVGMYNIAYRDAYYLQLQRRFDYIATVNNLQSQVVKTGDKTMKITYVLSFD